MTIDTIESATRKISHDLPSKADVTNEVATTTSAVEEAVHGAVDAAIPAVRDGAAQLVNFSKRKPIFSIAAAGAVGYAIYRATRSYKAA
jgi:hypothetical protein